MNRKNYRNSVKGNTIKLKLRKTIILVVTLIIVIFVIVSMVFTSENLFLLSSISLHGIDSSKIHWNKDWTMYLLTGSISSNNTMHNLRIIVLDKTSVRYISIPDDLYVVNDGSNLQLNSIYALSALQNQKNALNNFEKSFHDTLMLHIDSYFFEKSFPIDSTVNIPEYLTQKNGEINDMNIFFDASHLNSFLNNQVYTDLDKGSVYAVAKQLGNVNAITPLSIANNEISRSSVGESINTNIFMSGTASQLVDSGLQDEHARIALYNATGIPGKAELLSQIIQTRGGTTDFIGSNATVNKKTIIYCQNPTAFPNTINVLKRMFNAPVSKKSYSLSADISVVLGQDSLITY